MAYIFQCRHSCKVNKYTECVFLSRALSSLKNMWVKLVLKLRVI